MESKIDVSELLRNCPKGMELDCSCADNVVFDKIIEYEQIKCVIGDCHDPLILDKYGRLLYICCPKCVIFPKGKTTWEGFQIPFKDGDIVATDSGSVFILKSCLEDKIHYHSYIGVTCCNEIQEKQIPFAYKHVCHLATEEEKQKLFQAIKERGYKWNAETKTLEKLVEQKFKVGDRIRHKTHIRQGNVVTEIKDTHYILDDELALPFISQDEYELVPDKFDIKTLVPFESRILVRNADGDLWKPAIFGCYIKNKTAPYYALGGTCWDYCITYEMNEHLLGTTDDCDEYFKTWK